MKAVLYCSWGGKVCVKHTLRSTAAIRAYLPTYPTSSVLPNFFNELGTKCSALLSSSIASLKIDTVPFSIYTYPYDPADPNGR